MQALIDAKYATSTASVTSKTQNIEQAFKDAPGTSKSSELSPSKSTKAPSDKVFHLDKGQKEAFVHSHKTKTLSPLITEKDKSSKGWNFSIMIGLTLTLTIPHPALPLPLHPLHSQSVKRQEPQAQSESVFL